MRALLLAALLVPATAARAMQNNIGTSASEFMRLGAGARSLGMGEAYTAVAEGAETCYWNPAGLAVVNDTEINYTRAEVATGIHHDFMAVATPLRFIGGAVGLAFTRLSQDNLDLVDAANQTHGSFAPHSEVISLAYGWTQHGDDSIVKPNDYAHGKWNLIGADRPFVDQTETVIDGGIALKAVEENLGTRSAAAFAVDGGALIRPPSMHELVVGAAFRHVGSRIRFITASETLPSEFALAAAYDLREEDWRLLPAIEIDAPYSGNFYGKFGLETTRLVASKTWASARVGYNSRTVAELGALSGVTSGVGLQIGGFLFDAAFQPLAVLGESFRMSVGWKF